MSKTITDIIPPSRRRAMEAGTLPPSADRAPMPSYQAPVPPRPTPPPVTKRSTGGRGFPYGTALVALVLIAGSVVTLAAFANAKVTVTPTQTEATITDSLTATFQTGALPYEIVSVTKTGSVTVPAESTESANDPAQGLITIYNAQPNPQTLIKNTRFESPDGRIYRIHESVTIPAGTTAAPGSIQITAYADMGGESYNIGATSFTLPGLKGTAAFTLVTAKSTEPMTGGFTGTRPSVSQATRDAQNQKNQAALEASLIEEAQAKLPADYVIIPGGTFATYAPQSDTAADDGQVNINLKGSLVAVAFPNGALANAIAQNISGSYNGQPVRIVDPKTLRVTPSDPLKVPAGEATFSFTLTGPVRVLWEIDPMKVASAVAGKSKDSATQIVRSFPEIEEATLQVQPFWKQSFPEDPKDITVATTSGSTR